jgi:hypothetical protein
MSKYALFVRRTRGDKRKMGCYSQKKLRQHPRDKLCVDLIGPYRVRRKGKKDLICKCVTMIDPATGWFEIQQHDDKKSITVANIVEREWFTRYPWPTQVTFDRGSEFIGQEFQNMIKKTMELNQNPYQLETHRQML